MSNILFDESNDRYTLFPVKDNHIWNTYKQSISLFWVAEEIDLSQDKKSWDTLTPDEKYFIKMVLSFFASSDGMVNENLVNRFSNDVQLAEAKAVYSVQNFIETIHSETYALLLQSYVTDHDERIKCFKAIDNFPCIKRKHDWGRKWINSTESFNKRLVAFSIVEGLFFSGSFCAIYWLKKRGLMPGLTFSNELISRDEGMHTEFAVYLYKTYCDKIDQDTIHAIMHEAVEIETEFICESLPVRLIGMNSNLMTQYIQFIADRLLSQLGYEKIWNTQNPFQFMEMMSIEGKTNFFEKRVSEYSLSDGGDREKAFEFSGEF